MTQVYFPNFSTGIKFSFKLQCPGEFINNVLDLQLLHNGTVNGNVHYYDLCKVVNYVNIAYNNRAQMFNIDKVANTLVKFRPLPIKGKGGLGTLISNHFEIVGEFLTQNNIVPTWIDALSTYGWFDEKTGKWTGEIGKVWYDFKAFI